MLIIDHLFTHLIWECVCVPYGDQLVSITQHFNILIDVNQPVIINQHVHSWSFIHSSHMRMRLHVACNVVINQSLSINISIDYLLLSINISIDYLSMYLLWNNLSVHFACHMVINQLLSINISIDYLSMYLLWNNSSSIKMRLCVKEGSTNLN